MINLYCRQLDSCSDSFVMLFVTQIYEAVLNQVNATHKVDQRQISKLVGSSLMNSQDPPS